MPSEFDRKKWGLIGLIISFFAIAVSIISSLSAKSIAELPYGLYGSGLAALTVSIAWRMTDKNSKEVKIVSFISIMIGLILDSLLYMWMTANEFKVRINNE